MGRYVRAFPLALLALLLLATPASAGRTWCRADPDFTINGRLVHVYVSSDAAMYAAATGPVQVVLTVPSSVSVQLISADAGFGKGYTITIERSAKLKATTSTIQIQASVKAPATDSSLPVRVEIEWVKTNNVGTSIATKTRIFYGVANQWVVATASVT